MKIKICLIFYSIIVGYQLLNAQDNTSAEIRNSTFYIVQIKKQKKLYIIHTYDIKDSVYCTIVTKTKKLLSQNKIRINKKYILTLFPIFECDIFPGYIIYDLFIYDKNIKIKPWGYNIYTIDKPSTTYNNCK